MNEFDILIIGGGPGGYVAAIKGAQLGAKVGLIEKEAIGGVCLNWGCIPTKAMLKSAKVYKMMKNSESYGITITDSSTIKANLPMIVKRKDDVVKKLTGGVKTLLKKNGVTVFDGFAEVMSPKSVKVNDQLLSTKHLILATGASPIIPPIPGVKEALESQKIVTSKEILALQEIPKSLVIIGGGVIGIEFATMFSALGSKVTIIERLEGILMNIDEEIRIAYTKILKKENIDILTSSTVVGINNSQVIYEKDGNQYQVDADKILMSVGMKPNTKGIEKLNLEMNKSGVVVNDYMETSTRGIYAIGDLNGKMMLAHVASAQGIVAVENIMGKPSKIDYRRVPAGIYGSPEIAYVGYTEQELKRDGKKYKSSKFPISANGKALAEGESEGFVKVLIDPKYGEILGMHILAQNATDIIAEAVVTMELEGTVHEVAKAIHPHPTLSEIMMEVAHGAVSKPIHII
jgi:dihydrolipoamide dehydrogenase